MIGFVFLILNGHEIQASVDDQETLILGVASSQIVRDNLIEWLTDHVFEVKEEKQKPEIQWASL